jgi:hypothetical protein
VNPLFQFWEIKGSEEVGGPWATVFMGPTKLVSGSIPKCKGCDRFIEERSHRGAKFHAEGRDAKIWPDILFAFELIVSSRVVADLNENRITGFASHKIRIDKIDSPRLQKLSPPDYYLIETTGWVDVDRQLFDEGEGCVCPVCHNWTPKPEGKYSFGSHMLNPLMETWSGTDFVHIRSPAVGGHPCTTRVIELARSKKWIGAHFESITPRPFWVNLKSNNWFSEIETKARAEYPQFFVEGA